MQRVIGVVSGKGGVGKTTLVSNLGVALTKFGRDVTLVDCNVTTSHLAFCFGLHYYPVTLNNVLKKEATIKEATYFHSSGVKIIPASLKLSDLLDLEMGELMSSLISENAEIVILDSAPGLGKEAISVLRACDEVIFVTIPYLNAVSDIVRCYQVVKQLNVRLAGIVLNMVRNDPHELRENEIEKLTNIPVIAKIPFDKNVQKSLAQGMPTIMYKPYASSSVEMMKLAADLLNERYSPPKIGIFSRLYDTLKESFTTKKNFEIPIS